jgi:hypothetical protein
MDLKTKLTDYMSKELFTYINSKDYKKLSKEDQQESLKSIFDSFYEGLEEYSEQYMDMILNESSNVVDNKYQDIHRKNWLSALFLILIVSFSMYTVNNLFNILPRFSFLEAFGSILLVINIYSIASSYILDK